MWKKKNKKQQNLHFLLKNLCKKRHFWKKKLLVKQHFLMKKIIKLKILHKNLQILKIVKIEK